jgi:gamma-glutamylcyclotransferase (GGCT)/AIG2-like uncharacterized protein YtfP
MTTFVANYEKLFVYGIFLDAQNRIDYGMHNARYATVKNYVTVGNKIVSAYPCDTPAVALTGLVVSVDPSYWKDIDALEYGYKRIKVTTTSNEEAFMYVKGVEDHENYSLEK